ncbi:MAG: hypothetical protein JSW04_00290 [Desulfobacterales bacterium]|nr:MAG: hypothetical protein JSW04_00290 [Desulfobacterales bacterium]
MMHPIIFHKVIQKQAFILLILIAAILLTAVPAFSHGGKSHAEGSFTQLQALKQASKMYDQLIVSSKLDESWETNLVEVKISIRNHSGKKEVVVSFHRLKGAPEAVYFFFTPKGEYAGSNFTGE